MIYRIALATVLVALITYADTASIRAQTVDKPIGILLAAGDISTCGKSKEKAWHRYANRTAEIIRNVIKDAGDGTPPIPVRVLALGDLAYGTGTKEEFDCFAKRWSGFDELLLPVPGNHEYEHTNTDAAPYFAYFKNNALVNQNGEKKGYFVTNFPREDGPWRLIGLNPYVKGKGAMKAQMNWLEDKLDANKPANNQNCVLAFWHPPIFSSGKHGHGYKTESNAALTEDNLMRTAFRILYRHGASVVLAGHDHHYEQFSRHDADGAAKDDGIRSFIVGTGGSILTKDTYGTRAPNSENIYGKTHGTHGVLKIELFENSYNWDFLSIDGKKLVLKTTKDTCNIRKKLPL